MTAFRCVTARGLIAVLAILAGVVIAIMELFSGPKFFAAVGALVSGVWTGGLIFLGRSFMTESFLGSAGLLIMAIAGFGSFAFEQKGMDVDLASAQHDVALVLIRDDVKCKIPSRSKSFHNAALACGVQSTSDLSAAAVEGAKLAHLPTELDLMDKISSKFVSSNPDRCRELFEPIYRACPDSFAALDKAIVSRVLHTK